MQALWASIGMLRIGAVATLAARTVLVGRAVFYLLVVALLWSLWDRVAVERLPGTLAPLLPLGGLGLYVGVTEWIILSVPSIHLRLEDDIRSGAIEAQLLRPVPYPLMRVAETFGAMLVRMAVLGLVGLLGLALSGRAGQPVWVWLSVGLLGALGGLVGLLLFALVGLCAFWLRRTMPVYLSVQKVCFLLGGLFAPLTLYPGWLHRIAEATPFAAQLYWPAAMAMAPGGATLVRAAAMQSSWIAILALLICLLWRRGLQRLLRRGV
jgi:ABC-2 type transport system permease protein